LEGSADDRARGAETLDPSRTVADSSRISGAATRNRHADDAVEMLACAWNDVALPFYARFRTVADVARYVTPETVDDGNTPINCSVGVIAKLQSGSADYAQFVEFCRNYLAGISNGFYLQRLDRLLNRLQQARQVSGRMPPASHATTKESPRNLLNFGLERWGKSHVSAQRRRQISELIAGGFPQRHRIP
jgi:hypothetical protein